MSINNYFEFKQFRVIQEKSAMKVGIDGVLLGAWIMFGNCRTVLDVGAGTGLISLMAAQRTNARIDAIEIEPEAASEAELNFSNSKWSNRLNVIHQDFLEFEPDQKYDHIISNPPFFENSLKSTDEKRSKARHSDNLSLNELLTKAKNHLKENGKISMVLPAGKENNVHRLAVESQLHVSRECFVHPFQSKKPNRIMIELQTFPCERIRSKICIRDKTTNLYSKEFRNLTSDFYVSI